jgi:hypothetical protein
MATRNQTAGHNYERDVKNILNKIGFPHAVTSRSESRSRDNDKIDLCNRNEYKNGRLPFNIQCKSLTDHELESGKIEKVKYKELLAQIEMLEGISNVVLHRHTVRKGTKFMVQGEYAFMHQKDFFQLVEEREKYKKGFDALYKFLRKADDAIHTPNTEEAFRTLKELGL